MASLYPHANVTILAWAFANYKVAVSRPIRWYHYSLHPRRLDRLHAMFQLKRVQNEYGIWFVKDDELERQIMADIVSRSWF